MANPKNHRFYAIAFWRDSDSPEPYLLNVFPTRNEAKKMIRFWRDLWGDELRYYVEHYDDHCNFVSRRKCD